MRGSGLRRQHRIALLDDAVAEQALGLLEAALKISDGAHRPEIDAEVDERLRDARRQPGEDRACAHQPRRLNGLHEMVGDGHVDGRDTRDVDDDDLGAVCLDGAEECSVSCRARCESSTPMIGRMSSRPRTWSTGVESSRIAACWSRMTRSRSSTKLTPTVTAMRLAAGS